MTTFEPISLDRQAEYRQLLASTGRRASDYSFVNLWGWSEVYGLEWAWNDELVWIRQTKPETVYWAPVGCWRKVDWKAVEFPEDAKHFIRVPQLPAEMWRRELEAELAPARDHWDYLYLVDKMVGLDDEHLAKKRAQLEQFKRDYDWAYHAMTPDCVEEVLEMQHKWVKWRDSESASTLTLENEAIYRVLTHWDALATLTGGVIRISGEAVAYTVADELNEDTLVIHFEKGRPEYTGIYQAINQMFLAENGGNHSFVNREQDLGDPGLRKAKISYYPEDFVRKYEARMK